MYHDAVDKFTVSSAKLHPDTPTPLVENRRMSARSEFGFV